VFRNANSQGRAQALRLRTFGIYQQLPPIGVCMTLVELLDKILLFFLIVSINVDK
jgi:hypothetical protein